MHTIIETSVNEVIRRGLKRLRPDARPVMVVSHERSGTHFAMNSLAACFGYASLPWIDLDADDFNINYHHPEMLGALLDKLTRLHAANIIKCHHEFGFFSEILEKIPGLNIVYVYRRPADVMSSFWRFIHTWPWTEGPRTASAVEFANAAPMGRLMRYQQQQRESMLDRWAAHVSGWTQAAKRYENVHTVSYEDLNTDFEETILRLSARLDLQPIRMVRPPSGVVGVQAGPVSVQLHQSPQERNMIWQLALRRHPLLMRQLGYLNPPALRAAR